MARASDDLDLAAILSHLMRLEMSHEPPLSFTPKTAAAASGLSLDVINRAIRAGDLAVTHPVVNRRRIKSNVILREELIRWLSS